MRKNKPNKKIKIELPQTHPSLNTWSRWHWTKKSKIKKGFESDIGWLAAKYNEPQLESCDIEIIYYFKDNRTRDFDNYVPKFILDGLVKAGIIKDDNDNNIFLNWKLNNDCEEEKTIIIVTPRKT